MAEFIETQTEGRILTITMNRPGQLNCLNARACHELSGVWDEFIANDELWVAIITGAGPKAFCAGHDLAEDFFEPMPASGWAGLSHRTDLDKPVIAAVNGLALGGGWEIALLSDIIIAAPSARFGLPEPRVGFAALGGGARLLPHRMPYHVAMGLMLTGETIGADEAMGYGLVNEIARDGDVVDTARKWARSILQCSPGALRCTKQVGRASQEPAETRTCLQALEVNLAQSLSDTEDIREGLQAFREKRAPVWRGR